METIWKDKENINRNEIAKLEKDGLVILNELDNLSEMEMKDIPWDDVERLKWAGIYAKKPKNGHFLIRIKLPSGELTSKQARLIAVLAKEYGKDEIQITIRQCIQIHNITLADAVVIIENLKSVGLTTVGGCGDVPRNILGNPLMGIDPDELFDTTESVHQIAEYFTGNKDYSNLPRKFKISISANPKDGAFARINDIAFVPAIRTKGGIKEAGFHVYVGGGLSAEPHLACKLGIFVRKEQVIDVIEAVVTLFRDYGYREKRNHCRLKYLISDIGKEKVEEFIKTRVPGIERGGREYQRKWNYGRYHGVHPQKQEGFCYAGVNIPAGQLMADELEQIALLAEKYGNGSLRTTNSQCILIPYLKNENINQFKNEEILKKYKLSPGFFEGYAASCTGNKYCNFAPIDTKYYMKKLVSEMEMQFSYIDTPIRINVTGCVHSCAHAQIADIGLIGGKKMIDGQVQDTFSVFIGGSLGKDSSLGIKMDSMYTFDKVITIIKGYIDEYLCNRKRGELFTQYIRRSVK